MALTREKKLAGTPIGTINTPLDQLFAFELIDNQASVLSINTNSFSKQPLLDTWHFRDDAQQRELELDNIAARECFCKQRGADLLKASSERRRILRKRNAAFAKLDPSRMIARANGLQLLSLS